MLSFDSWVEYSWVKAQTQFLNNDLSYGPSLLGPLYHSLAILLSSCKV